MFEVGGSILTAFREFVTAPLCARHSRQLSGQMPAVKWRSDRHSPLRRLGEAAAQI
jgi:hypothetical protein